MDAIAACFVESCSILCPATQVSPRFCEDEMTHVKGRTAITLAVSAALLSRSLFGQASPPPVAPVQDRPSFEVASVKPAPEFRNAINYPAPHPPRALASGQFDATATLGMLIGWAFHNTPSLVKGPFRELDDVFVVSAKAAGPVPRTRPGVLGPMNLMLQSLLADRFKLRVRWDTRKLPVYALRRTSSEQLGKNLKRLDPMCPES